ncbi:MAG TPA: outer membrane beta-barrel protein [Syntrophales bacterium]|nr:outer membrane beta-barrel protein [Syntrophales bacterium]
MLVLAGNDAEAYEFRPYLSIEEQFTDNVELAPDNEKSDFITTVSPGLRVSGTGPGYAADLDYKIGFVKYARETDRDYLSHTGVFNGRLDLSRKLNLQLREQFVRSRDPAEPLSSQQATTSVGVIPSDRNRPISYRNILEPQIEYRFGSEDSVGARFRDNKYETDSAIFQDSREDSISPFLRYWITPRHGFAVDYEYVKGDFERTPDMDGHLARTRYIFRPKPSVSVWAEYMHTVRDFDSPGNSYRVVQPFLGTDYTFSPSLSGRLQAGWFAYKPDRGDNISEWALEAALLKRTPRVEANVTARKGYAEDYFAAENLGFAKSTRLSALLNYRLDREWSVGASGRVERAEFIGRTDKIWGMEGTIGYEPLRWLTLTLRFGRTRFDAGADFASYTENRITLQATAVYW